MSLDSFGKGEEENELNVIKQQLEKTNNLVWTLSKHLDELKEQVCLLILYLFILKKNSIKILVLGLRFHRLENTTNAWMLGTYKITNPALFEA